MGMRCGVREAFSLQLRGWKMICPSTGVASSSRAGASIDWAVGPASAIGLQRKWRVCEGQTIREENRETGTDQHRIPLQTRPLTPEPPSVARSPQKPGQKLNGDGM